MGLMSWLKAKLSRSAKGAALREPTEGSDDLSRFLTELSRDLSLDAHTRRYLAHYITQARLQIRQGQSVLFGPETTIEELAAEGAYQGLLDPKRRGAATGVVLRDDLLMRILIHFARLGNARCASGVRSFADGTFKKRSQIRGTEEARRIAQDFVARQG